jgi:type I site-specific restriction endonuclease
MSLSEAATHKRRIDKAIAGAGWVPAVPYDPHASCDLVVFEEYPTVNDPADYVLFHEGAPPAIMEAKQLSPGLQKVLQQAQRHAQGLDRKPFRLSRLPHPLCLLHQRREHLVPGPV